MTKREKFFLIWIAITFPLAMLLTIVGGIVCIFNNFVGQVIFFTGLGIKLFLIVTPYIIGWMYSRMIELIRKEN